MGSVWDTKSIITLLVPVLISMVTFIYAAFRKANDDYVSQLEKRLILVEETCARCVEERDTLSRENRELLIEVVKIASKQR